MKQQVTLDLKWFCFMQNNSGGKFVHDENVDEYVFVQDVSAERAIARAKEFCDNSDSCPCCGDRWSFWIGKGEGTDEPEMYEEVIWDVKPDSFSKQAKLHFFDGAVKTYKFGEPPISNPTARP